MERLAGSRICDHQSMALTVFTPLELSGHPLPCNALEVGDVLTNWKHPLP